MTVLSLLLAMSQCTRLSANLLSTGTVGAVQGWLRIPSTDGEGDVKNNACCGELVLM